jgi:hypothetical protein
MSQAKYYILLLAAFIFVSSHSYAQQDDAFYFNEYYTIDDGTISPVNQTTEPIEFLDPAEVAIAFLDRDYSLHEVVIEKVLNLLSWLRHPEAPEAPTERYNRRIHFGGWINDPADETCHNTRAKVLIRDSKVPVTLRTNNKCIVDTGSWDDSYSGRNFTIAREIQIDHMVPLKNAYLSGAHKWDSVRRCHYANFLGDENHLVSASGRENTAKGDRTPHAYMPSNTAVHCQYLKNWLAIKLYWGLILTPPEAESITHLIQQQQCSLSDFKVSLAQLNSQRRMHDDSQAACERKRITAPPVQN